MVTITRRRQVRGRSRTRASRPRTSRSTPRARSASSSLEPGAERAPRRRDVRTADFHAFEEGGRCRSPRIGGTSAADAARRRRLPVRAQPRAGVRRDRRRHGLRHAAGGERRRRRRPGTAHGVEDPAAGLQGPRPRWRRHRSERPRPEDAPDGRHPAVRRPRRACYMPDAIAPTRRAGRPISSPRTRATPREWGDYVGALARQGPRRATAAAACARQPARRDSPATPSSGASTSRRRARLRRGRRLLPTSCTRSAAASFSIWTDRRRAGLRLGRFVRRDHRTRAVPTSSTPNHTESDLEGRSDDKGPEPEGLSIGTVDGRTYAFVGFERVGGIAVYDITDPRHPGSSPTSTTATSRSRSEDADDPAAVLSQAGDLGPEGVTFIPAASSATGSPLLAVANEVSGTTTLFSVVDQLAPVAPRCRRSAATPTSGPEGEPGHVDTGRRHRQGRVVPATSALTLDGEPIREATEADVPGRWLFRNDRSPRSRCACTRSQTGKRQAARPTRARSVLTALATRSRSMHSHAQRIATPSPPTSS